MSEASVQEQRFKYRDRSGLSLGERNAVIFYAKGDKEAAAKALGWTAGKMRELGPLRVFIEKEIVRIKEKAQARAERRPPPPEPERPKPRRKPMTPPAIAEPPPETRRPSTPSRFEDDLVAQIDERLEELRDLEETRPTIEERVRLEAARRVLEHPDRIDEREAQPPPPDEDIGKLDEREPQVPPTPSPPPIREEEPEDMVPGKPPSLDHVRAWIAATYSPGEKFRAGDIREQYDNLSRITATHRLGALVDEGFLERTGQKAGTRYSRV